MFFCSHVIISTWKLSCVPSASSTRHSQKKTKHRFKPRAHKPLVRSKSIPNLQMAWKILKRYPIFIFCMSFTNHRDTNCKSSRFWTTRNTASLPAAIRTAQTRSASPSSKSKRFYVWLKNWISPKPPNRSISASRRWITALAIGCSVERGKVVDIAVESLTPQRKKLYQQLK